MFARLSMSARTAVASKRLFASSYSEIKSDAEYTKFMGDHKTQDKLVVVDWFATCTLPANKCSLVWPH